MPCDSGCCLLTKWKTSIISGFQSVFWGASVWADGRRRRDERKERRRVYSHKDGVLQFDFTVKTFPGIIVGKTNMIEVYYKHSAVIKRVAFSTGVYVMCDYVCHFVVVCVCQIFKCSDH